MLVVFRRAEGRKLRVCARASAPPLPPEFHDPQRCCRCCNGATGCACGDPTPTDDCTLRCSRQEAMARSGCRALQGARQGDGAAHGSADAPRRFPATNVRRTSIVKNSFHQACNRPTENIFFGARLCLCTDAWACCRDDAEIFCSGREKVGGQSQGGHRRYKGRRQNGCDQGLADGDQGG